MDDSSVTTIIDNYPHLLFPDGHKIYLTSVDGLYALVIKPGSHELFHEPTLAKPTAAPTAKPTAVPTAKPTAAPMAKPTAASTAKPTAAPTAKPTTAPTAKPTVAPMAEPTAEPTAS